MQLKTKSIQFGSAYKTKEYSEVSNEEYAPMSPVVIWRHMNIFIITIIIILLVCIVLQKIMLIP